MAKNKIEDLRNHLFAQLERLNDEDITSIKIEEEVRKARAITSISDAIVETAKVEIQFLEAAGITKTTSQLFKGLDDEPKKLNGYQTINH